MARFDLADLGQTALRVLRAPAAFFRDMPRTGGYQAPLVFLAAAGLVGGIADAAMTLSGFHPGVDRLLGLVSVAFMPIFTVAFGFLGAGILYLIWRWMGARELYETAFRCVAYLGALTPVAVVLSAFPRVGLSLGLVLATVYAVAASVEVAGIERPKAWTVFGLLAGVLIALSLLHR